MILLSLALNLLVLIPVCSGLVIEAPWAKASYGDKTPARGILLSVYLAIAIVSALLLFAPDYKLVAALLLVQIIYKITTPFTVGTLSHPVVLSNLGIAAFHLVTLTLIWNAVDLVPATP